MLSLFSLPVMPQAYWKDHKLSDPLSRPPLGGGPYRISQWKMGQYIVYTRVKDYWAANLPVNRGRWNFDVIRYDYYLDDNVAFEAFKAGAFDLRLESDAKNWATRLCWQKTLIISTSSKMSRKMNQRRIRAGWRSTFSAPFSMIDASVKPLRWRLILNG
ncbi:ABC transporter substrate-binding protein [Citrobacter amalonaticus]|nr:ABC transporter substrate-binding protein [Citrobacter amalonaticus]